MAKKEEANTKESPGLNGNKDRSLTNVPDNLPVPRKEDDGLIGDNVLIGIYEEILCNLRGDRGEIDELATKFAEMVINEGDSTTSSKEALVNLVKMKSETNDKMAKIADLMTRVKLKEKDTGSHFYGDKRNLTIIDQSGSSKRALLEAIKKAKGK